jgi:MFS superfamily sulfate permease-like transporter
MNTLDVVFTILLYALPITMMAALVLLIWMNARLGNLVRLARKYSNEVKES